jgi:hypothetical protein
MDKIAFGLDFEIVGNPAFNLRHYAGPGSRCRILLAMEGTAILKLPSGEQREFSSLQALLTDTGLKAEELDPRPTPGQLAGTPLSK